MGNGLQGTLLPVRASIEDFSALDIGVMGSAYFIGFALGCFYGGHMVGRVGHIRTFTAMAAIASAAVLAHSIIVLPLLWWCLRAITGMCFAVLYLVIESWLNEKATNENRGFIFSIYTFINLTVVTIGQLMLTLDDPIDFTLFALASILVSIAAVPVAMTTTSPPKPVQAVKVRFAHLYRLSPVGMIGCLGVGLANGAFWSLAPIYAETDAHDVTNVAIFMSITVIAGAIGQIPFGRMSDRMDRRLVMLVSCVGAAIAALGLVMVDPSWPYLDILVTFMFGLFAFPLYTLCVAHTNDHIEPSGYVESASGLLMVYAVGAIFGSLIASGVMQIVGDAGLFLFTMTVHSAIAIFILYRIRQRVAPPLEEHIPFKDALNIAQTVANVDPMTPQDSEPVSVSSSDQKTSE